MQRTGVVVMLSLFLSACGSDAPQPQSPKPSAPAPAPAAAGAHDAKTLLANVDKIRAFATYRLETAPHTKLALDISMKGASGKDDPRVLEYQQLNDAALQKTGLVQADVSAFSLSTSELVSTMTLAREAGAAYAKNLDEAKAEFVQKYGQQALDNVVACEKELCEAQDASMKAALGK